MNTKKILLYGGGALVLGAVGFFVWSFFQKPTIPIRSTTIALGSNPSINDSTDNTSADNNTTTNGIPANATQPIVASNTDNTSLPPKFDPNTNNPFQPIDDPAYSDLDVFIHRGV